MTNSSGIGTPSWYEWEIGLIRCLEMLYDESIMSVVFQSSAFQSIDDVVVNYKDHSMINIQVKHTDVSANFNYSFITSDGNLLLSLAQDWLKVKSKYNIKEKYISACVIPYIIAFNAYGLRSSGLYELIEEFYMFFTSQNWLDIFKSCTSGNFSIDERNFYYINDDIEIFNVYYNRCNHPEDCERIFNQRAQMQMNWITASGQIQVSTYELKIDNNIRTMGDFTRKHLGL